jgi:hypothetical protein
MVVVRGEEGMGLKVFFFFFFFGTHFILEYKPEAKPSRNYEPLHL